MRWAKRYGRADVGGRHPRHALDELEHLVAPRVHRVGVERLEVQAQQRLGVRRAHVEVPVGELERDPVQVRDPVGRRAVALLQLLAA